LAPAFGEDLFEVGCGSVFLERRLMGELVGSGGGGRKLRAGGHTALARSALKRASRSLALRSRGLVLDDEASGGPSSSPPSLSSSSTSDAASATSSRSFLCSPSSLVDLSLKD